MSLGGAVVGKLRRAAGRVRNKLGPRSAVLLYHRVADCADDPYLLRVRPKNFAQQMEVVRKVARPMSLKKFTAEWRAGRMPHRAVVVTFDDGYADNLYTAKPLLERHDVPATVFMTTGTIGRTREFWWDELERIVLKTPKLPAKLELDGKMWELNGASTSAASHNDWNLTHASDPTDRHRLLRGVHEHIRTMPHEARQSVLDRVAAWAGVRTDEVRPAFRAMNDSEVVDLARGGLVEVGAHTVTHASLPALSYDAQLNEMTTSRQRMRDVIGGDVTSFAYPYGDHDTDTMRAAQEAGFDVACACLSRIATPRHDPFALPRLDMLDWDGDAFAETLEGWLRG